MTTQQAEELLTDENISQTAVTLAALDRLQSEEFNLMEPELRKLGKFSESDAVNSAERALSGYTAMAIPGNGNGIKMTLSVFMRGLQILGRDKQVESAMRACETYENLTT